MEQSCEMSAGNYNLFDLFKYDENEGIIRVLGQRAVLFDAVALGFLRKELIDSFGVSVARSILTRMGYAHGWRVAEVLHTKFPMIFADVQAGAHCHKLYGITVSTDFKSSNGQGDEPLIQASWVNSVELEQHLLLFGKGEEPVCWMLTGFASGYESYKNGREVYFIEHKCIGRGDAICQMQGRFKEKWSEAYREQLGFFSLASADQVLKELTLKLKKTEAQIARKQRQLDLLEPVEVEHFGFSVRSKAMQQLISLARHVARVDMSVVVMGESGVGKERIARFIHEHSTRAMKAFVAVNCGALSETLLESELFGHTKGAFTGADRDRAGLFEEAAGGTIFLDEIGEVSANMQVKLLRVLQEKEVRRLGENKVRPVNIRVIAATNRNLAEDVASGRFRADLYYRLCVIEITVPPLRDHPEDILPLARLFLEQAKASMSSEVHGFSPQAMASLLAYHWPGNIRELNNVVARSLALCPGKMIEAEDLPPALRAGSLSVFAPGKDKSLADVEREYILAVLHACDGNKRLAAKKLQISPSSLYRKLNEYGERGA